MIAGCPTCAARYRIDTAKLRPEGARLRCSRCETVFRVQPPVGAPTIPAARKVESEAPVDPAKQVLVAHPDPEAGKVLADALSSWGLHAQLVHDGVDAILNVQRLLPRMVVLDAALPKMFGFQVCELMKRNEQLRSIPVVLIGAIHDRDRYRRAPEEIYGADAYAERHELPGALAAELLRFGLIENDAGAGASPPAPTPAATRSAAEPGIGTAPPPAPVETSVPAAGTATPPPASLETPPSEASGSAAAPATQTPGDAAPAPPSGDDPEIEKGLRLARIIVSDVILYNPEKFEAGIRAGNVVDALANELEEGFALFAQRVDTNVCDPREFLERELVRVARSRGMS